MFSGYMVVVLGRAVGVLLIPVLGLSAVRAGCDMDTLALDPRAFHMQTGRGTTTPCAQYRFFCT